MGGIPVQPCIPQLSLSLCERFEVSIGYRLSLFFSQLHNLHMGLLEGTCELFTDVAGNEVASSLHSGIDHSIWCDVVLLLPLLESAVRPAVSTGHASCS